MNLKWDTVSTNNTNQYGGISTDNNYNIKNIDFSVKSKEIETSSCNSMMDVNINKDIYDKKWSKLIINNEKSL